MSYSNFSKIDAVQAKILPVKDNTWFQNVQETPFLGLNGCNFLTPVGDPIISTALLLILKDKMCAKAEKNRSSGLEVMPIQSWLLKVFWPYGPPLGLYTTKINKICAHSRNHSLRQSTYQPQLTGIPNKEEQVEIFAHIWQKSWFQTHFGRFFW